LSFPTTFNQTKNVIFTITVVVLALTIFWEYTNIVDLQSKISTLNNEVADQNRRINEYTAANPKLINAGFNGSNFTGVVYNQGQIAAKNVKIILYTATTNSEWTFEINVGTVNSEEFKTFNNYVPVPSEYKFSAFWPKLEWS
jgi:hypothetical protein